MKPRFAYFGTIILLIPLLSACSLGGDDPNTNVVTPTPPNTTTLSADKVPPYLELRTKFKDLHNRLVNSQDQQAITTTQVELITNWNGLTGKSLVGWNGWVVKAGAAVSESVQFWGGFTADLAKSTQAVDSVNSKSLLLTLDDPYAAQTSSQNEKPALGVVVLQPMIILINREGAAAEQPFSIGQKVAFTGTIQFVSDSYIRQGLGVASSDITLVGGGIAQTPAAADLQDVVVSLERTACFGACPDYRVTAYGDGTVVFEGRLDTKVSGFRITRVGEDKIRQLILEFDKADFYSLKDYTEYGVTDLPSAITSITLPDKSKTVNHYFGDSHAPEGLKTLEDKIDEVLGTAQWVK